MSVAEATAAIIGIICETVLLCVLINEMWR